MRRRSRRRGRRKSEVAVSSVEYRDYLELIVTLWKIKSDLQILQMEFAGVNVDGVIEALEEVFDEIMEKLSKRIPIGG